MGTPYLCPNCKTNKTRFNVIDQVAKPVKMDPNNGDIMEEYASEALEPLHIAYNGPERKVQCAVCGQIDEEQSFIKRAEYEQKHTKR